MLVKYHVEYLLYLVKLLNLHFLTAEMHHEKKSLPDKNKTIKKKTTAITPTKKNVLNFSVLNRNLLVTNFVM